MTLNSHHIATKMHNTHFADLVDKAEADLDSLPAKPRRPPLLVCEVLEEVDAARLSLPFLSSSAVEVLMLLLVEGAAGNDALLDDDFLENSGMALTAVMENACFYAVRS